PLYPNASGAQNSSQRRPSSRSKNRWPASSWRTSDSPDGRLRSGSTQLPPTGTNCPLSTLARMRSQRSGFRSLIHAYCCACERAQHLEVLRELPRRGVEAGELAARKLDRRLRLPEEAVARELDLERHRAGLGLVGDRRLSVVPVQADDDAAVPPERGLASRGP